MSRDSRLELRAGSHGFDRVTMHPCLPGNCPGMVDMISFNLKSDLVWIIDYMVTLGFEHIVKYHNQGPRKGSMLALLPCPSAGNSL